MLKGRKLILYELNEVPRRVMEDFVFRYPGSACAKLLRLGRFFETLSEETGVLSPWITWPSVHRGVSNEKHCISDFGQDLTEVNAEYPSVLDLLAREGVRVGVFGSLHTYPLPSNVDRYAFYVPDTFANGPECFPESLSMFQDFNLRMVDSSGRNVSKAMLLGPAARFLTHAPRLGLRLETAARLCGQLLSERLNSARTGRRRTSQMQIAFDLFYQQLRLHRPDLATFFTNHVASSMHRYWPAKFPEDYKDTDLGHAWQTTYADEIDFTMREVDRQVSRLVSFVEKNASYALVIASSMGQAAVDSSTVVHTQLYITDPTQFMQSLGIGAGGWVKHRAMLPRYIFKITDSDVDTFRKALVSMTVNGVPLQFAELSSNTFQVKFGHVNLSDKGTIVCLRGEHQPLSKMGLANVSIQDESGSYAYHIPQGIMILYDPNQVDSKSRTTHRRTISTLDVAPMILSNFGVPRPAYMRSVLS